MYIYLFEAKNGLQGGTKGAVLVCILLFGLNNHFLTPVHVSKRADVLNDTKHRLKTKFNGQKYEIYEEIS